MMNKKSYGLKFLGILSIAATGNSFGMQEQKKIIKKVSSQIALETNKNQKKQLNKSLSNLKNELKQLQKKEREERFVRLSVYNLLNNELRSKPCNVLALKTSYEKSKWYLDDVRLDGEGKQILWSGRYARSYDPTLGLTHLFAIDSERNLIKQGSVGLTAQRCDNVVSVFSKKNPALFAFFANGVQLKEYGLVRRCKSLCDEENYSIISQYYNVGSGAGGMGAGDFGYDDNLLVFSRGSTLYYHKRTDDYPNLENSTFSFTTDDSEICDIQISPNNAVVGVLHEEGNHISFFKTLSSKSNRIEVKEGELKEFVISGDSKAYITIACCYNEPCTLVNAYDAKTGLLRATCKIPGILYNDFTATRKCYFAEHDEWFIVPVINNGRLATVVIDSSSWKIAHTIVHGKERNKHLFKMAGVYGTFIRNKKKKVYIFDIRNASNSEQVKVDEIDVNSVPRFAFMSPQGYIVTASIEGEQPNVELYEYK